MKELLGGAIIISILTGSLGIAQAKTFNAVFAGSTTATQINFGGDAQNAITGQGLGKGKFIGLFFWHWLREWTDLLPGDAMNRCPPGEIERDTLHHTMLFSAKNGKNQLFFRLAEGNAFSCFNPIGGVAGRGKIEATLDIVGGTHKFENASGQVVMECTFNRLASLPGRGVSGPPHVAQGAQNCMMSGNIDF